MVAADGFGKTTASSKSVLCYDGTSSSNGRLIWPVKGPRGTMMATVRALVTICFILALGSETSIALPPQDMPAEVKSCKAIADDKDRLKCFDRLFGETYKPRNPSEGAQANWSIEETKSLDGNA